MVRPTGYRLGIYDPDPDDDDVRYSSHVFPATPAGIREMRSVIWEFYDRGNPLCVGIFPAERVPAASV